MLVNFLFALPKPLCFLQKTLTGLLATLLFCITLPSYAALPPLSSGKGSERFANFKRLIPPTFYITLSDSRKIPVRQWHAEGREKAVILALHGFNDSRDAWEIPAPLFTQQGITLYAPDIEGFGGTAQRGRWPGIKTMVADTVEEALYIHNLHPNIPLYLMGESMGASILITLQHSSYRNALPPIKGLILLAPAVRLLDIPTALLLDIASTFSPNWTVEPSDAPQKIVASNNRLALIRTYYNPLTIHKTSFLSLSGLVELMDKANAATPTLAIPNLVVYGGNDQLIPADSMGPLAKTFSKTTRFDFIPQGHHLLLRDKEYTTTANDILSWIFIPQAFLPSGGDISAAAWVASTPWDNTPSLLAPSSILDQ